MTRKRTVNLSCAVGILSLCIFGTSAPAMTAGQSGSVLRPAANHDRVESLFGEMRRGKLLSVDFPHLEWGDIEGLLKIGPSKKLLRRFPVNPLSSQLQTECTEGMVALWLIEGIRKGGKGFPSLNALVCPLDKGPSYEVASESHHAKTYEAYRSWWSKAKSMPKADASRIDPLAGSDLVWYGASR